MATTASCLAEELPAGTVIQIERPDVRQKRLYHLVKRVFDAVCALLGLLLLALPMLLIALIVALDSPGPAIFRQERLGLNGKPFMIYKFRTMRLDAEANGPRWAAVCDTRCTRFGHFLRRTRLDELPQLFNILKGEMSIVGPRPALWNQDDLVAERDKYGANDCVPGLTGYAQVHGRDELPIPEKARLDGYYARHLSFWLDVKIFFRTIGSVLHHDGVVEGRQKE